MWKKRRGVAVNTVIQVEEELRKSVYSGTSVPPPPEPDIPTPLIPPGGPSQWTWAEVLSTITQAQRAKTLTPEATKAAHVALGVKEFSEMISRDTLWDGFMVTLGLIKPV